MYYNLLIIFIISLLPTACAEKAEQGTDSQMTANMENVNLLEEIVPGAHQLDKYVPLLQGKRVSMVVNHTSLLGTAHLVDSLMTKDVEIINIFAPEHGFRGTADAGAHIDDEKDAKTGLPIISLYGKKRGPSAEDLATTDVVVFDIQDVGARFYTYISTLHYVMQACVEQDKPLIVLDRPNPNGHYVDGPMREAEYRSFVGMHPVPVVYGMTIGEYAQMINGEGWLETANLCQLTVIPIQGYSHQSRYTLPVAPSPNLPNARSILLYPSLCFFEGTPLSIGRGTSTQFQVIGHPLIPSTDFTFTPRSMFGAQNPKLRDEVCHGEDLQRLTPDSIFTENRLNLGYILKYYHLFPEKDKFFNANLWFDKLAGTAKLRNDIIAGKSEQEIRSAWEGDLKRFREIRAKYLIYP